MNSLYHAALVRARRKGLPSPLAHLVAGYRYITASPDRIVFAGCVVLFLAVLVGGVA